MNKEGLYDYMSQYLSEGRKMLFEKVIEDRTKHICVVLEDVFQPHNASAVMRTCDLIGIQDIHTIEKRNDHEINPEISLGSHQWMNRISHSTSKECVAKLKEAGYSIVATSPHSDAYSPENIPIDQPMAICFGTEMNGLSNYILGEADHHLKIPMYGFTESYNISVSAALCVYTIMQRLRDSDLPWQLNRDQQLDILLDWSRSSLKRADLLEKRFEKDQLS